MKTAVADDQPKPGVKMTEEQLKQKINRTKELNPHTICFSAQFFLLFLCLKGYSDTVNGLTYLTVSVPSYYRQFVNLAR